MESGRHGLDDHEILYKTGGELHFRLSDSECMPL